MSNPSGYDKLIDFRISRSRYTVGEVTGRIRNVTLRNIDRFTTRYAKGIQLIC